MKRDIAFIEGIEVEVLEFNETVETVEKASRLSAQSSDNIIKTILLKIDGDFLVALARGDRRVDLKKASQLLRKNVTLAKPNEVIKVLGVEVGAVTPISPKVKQVRVILDPAVLEKEYILCGGGALNKLFRVRTSSLIEYLKPEIMDVFKSS